MKNAKELLINSFERECDQYLATMPGLNISMFYSFFLYKKRENTLFGKKTKLFFLSKVEKVWFFSYF